MSKYFLLAAVLGILAGCKGGSEVATTDHSGSGSAPKAGLTSTSEREVTFTGYKGLELKGSFLPAKGVPKGPAMLLIPGSGPTDRDGNQTGLTTDLLKQIAARLSSDGISSLRFDKRAVPGTYASKFPKDPAVMDDFFSWQAFTDDATAAFHFLKSQSEVDGARVGLFGHSEGGLIVLAIAKNVSPKATILASTPGRDLGDLIIEQVAQQLPAMGAANDVQKKLNSDVKRIVEAIRKNGKVPNDVPAQLAPLFPSYAGGYLHSVMTLQPSEAAKTLTGPVLILQGLSDVQVSPDRDAPKLKEAIKQSELFLVPGASHNLKLVSAPHDLGFSGPIKPEAMDKISSFLKAQL